MSDTTEKRPFGGPQPGSGRPRKSSVRVGYNLAEDVAALLEKGCLVPRFGKDATAVVERAVRELAVREGVSIPEENAK